MKNADVALDRTIRRECNNESYLIERRTEIGSCTSIGFVDEQNSTNIGTQYTYIDTIVHLENHLYRLRPIDYDGRECYSEVIALKYVEKDGRYDGISDT